MKLNFKKIVSVLAATVMLGGTVAFATAAWPDPFVKNGAADAAIVYGAAAPATAGDYAGAVDLGTALDAKVTATGGAPTISGETIPLYTGGTKLYINDSLSTVKNVLTKSDLPTVLADGSFSGNVDATITQTLDIGSNPRVMYAKQPTSSDDPVYGLSMSTSTANYVFNLSATFSKAVNLSHADSKNQELKLFGQKFTIGASTDGNTLILLRSATKLDLDSDTPEAKVTIEGQEYTVKLVSASDTGATIKVTNAAGATDQKEITEGYSKKINGLTIAVNTADETNFKFTASLVAGAEKVTLVSGSSVTSGESDTVIDGTKVTFGGSVAALTKITISYAAADSDKDAIKAGGLFEDSVFKAVKLSFADVSNPEGGANREEIAVKSNGDDKMNVKFMDFRNKEATVTWAKNFTSTLQLVHDDDGRNISVVEREGIHYGDYVVVGNEDEGYLLKLSAVKNATTGTSNDYVKFQDVFSGDTYETVWTADGTGTASIQGKSYTINLSGDSNNASEEYLVRLEYPDSSTAGDLVVYPTIQTSKGARVAFYEPMKDMALTNFNAGGSLNGKNIMFPDGDGYTNVAVAYNKARGGASEAGWWNFTYGSTTREINTSEALGVSSATLAIGQLTYNVTSSGVNTTDIYLISPGGANIVDPALVVFEEKDDNNVYEALVITLETGASSDDGLGINNVVRTWNTGTSTGAELFRDTMASNSKLTKQSDLWGTIVVEDTSDSDQKTATISYPDEQVYAMMYAASSSAVFSTTDKVKVVKDSEISSVSTKNLIVVGGSCINTVAAKILGSETPVCGDAFSSKTTVGPGKYLIQVAANPYAAADSGKIAMLVAGYESADTAKAVAKVKEGTTATTVGTKIVGPVLA